MPSELQAAGRRAYSRYRAHVLSETYPQFPNPSTSSANVNSQSTASFIISTIWSCSSRSNRLGSSRRTVLITSNAKFDVRAARRGTPSWFRSRVRSATLSSAGNKRRRTRRRKTILRCSRQSKSNSAKTVSGPSACGVSRRSSSSIEFIHLKQNSAFFLIAGMFSTA